ncbi:hypothetical protein SUGI_0875000 [Cryptomeria japonica]|nr:hypothetical protein SUGI_0875000 [Cryptomeria japonica]
MGSNGGFKLKKALCSSKFFWRFLGVICVLFYPLLLFWFSAFQCTDSPRSVFETANIFSRPKVFSYKGDLLKLGTSWNALTFTSKPPQKHLKIALFVKKWPAKDKAGGLERHALTLHRVLAQRGHQLHIFTGLPTDPSAAIESDKSMHFHFTNYSDPVNRFINKEEAWSKFQIITRQVGGFDIIHTESVALPHKYAKGLNNVVATWQGIGYESTHSSIVQELTRDPADPRTPAVDKELKDHLEKVIQEIRFFQNYKHHVGTSDYMGDVLRRVYMLPVENVHIILNGVDEDRFRADPGKGRAFRVAHGVPLEARLVLGDGPWASRYKELGPNVKVLGPLGPGELGDFYNALDLFMNPTLRAQGLDQTTLEAMLCGKAVFATHFGSIVRSAIVSEEFGYTFSPTHESLKKELERVLEDGKRVLEKKGRACGKRAALLFTAQKMAASFERLFLCIAKKPEDTVDFCTYPLPADTI